MTDSGGAETGVRCTIDEAVLITGSLFSAGRACRRGATFWRRVLALGANAAAPVVRVPGMAHPRSNCPARWRVPDDGRLFTGADRLSSRAAPFFPEVIT